MAKKYIVKIMFDKCNNNDIVFKNYHGLRYYEIKPDSEFTITIRNENDNEKEVIKKEINKFYEKNVANKEDFSKHSINIMSAYVFDDKGLLWAYSLELYKWGTKQTCSYSIRDLDRGYTQNGNYKYQEEDEHYTIRHIAQLDDEIKRDKKNLFREHLHIALLALKAYFAKDIEKERDLEIELSVSNMLIDQYRSNLKDRLESIKRIKK